MRRYIVIFSLIAVSAIVGISFYQPPMRLMPAPALFLNGQTNTFSDAPETTDPQISLFYATNRLPFGPRDNRIYTVVPGRDLNLGVATIRIGNETTTWERIYEWSTGASDDRRPFLHLENMAEQASLADTNPLPEEASAWFAQINDALAHSRNKDIIVYVHGANTTVERAAGQAAQLHHFTGRDTIVVLFVWPTAENFLRYTRDMITSLGAAPHLATLIELLAKNTSAEKIDVLTYSAGATVGSNGLALVGAKARDQGPEGFRLGEIYHAAPDADFRSFVDDMRAYAGQVRRITVGVNLSDAALRLSQFVNRASRAGRPDMAELDTEATDWLLGAAADYGLNVVRVRPEGIPGLSRGSHTFWYDDPWVSSDVLLTLFWHLRPGDRGLVEGNSRSGTPYWSFPPDYRNRLAAVLARLQGESPRVPSEAVK